jgi:hypothetical protein
MKQEEVQSLDDAALAELRATCRDIVGRNWNEKVWSAHESDDEFQTEHLCGGFDATEQAFCFSWYSSNGKEYWFQFPLAEAENLAASSSVSVRLRAAE